MTLTLDADAARAGCAMGRWTEAHPEWRRGQERIRMPDNNIPADHPMNEIARQFRAPAESVAESPDADSDAPLDGDAPSSTDPTASPETQPEAPLLSLMPGQIGAPAFFVDRRLMVRWVAPGRADTLSSALHEEVRADSERNIFSLLQRSSVKAAVKDWSTLFSFAYVVLRRSTAKDLFDSGTAVIDRRQRFRLDDQRQADSDDRSFVLESRLLENDAPSGQAPLRIFGVGLKEGTLFVLRQDPWCDPDADPPGARRPAQATFDEPDLKACVCILSVRLDDSHRISDTMLPEIFFRLMHIVWEAVDDVAAALGGRRIGSDGVHNPYLFKAGAGRHPVFSAMCCAARINGRLSSLAPRIAD
ncbi:MAG TPA: hypothetical protein VLT88_15670, partial [Desulfosarcina sp.]|nr:hypothetical protein [Desulfosarcina sp.]